MNFVLDFLTQGFAYAFLAMGVYVSYKVLDYADLTVEGSFPLGAAITAVCIINGINPFVALFLAFISGGIVGAVTGLLHVKLDISSLLSGILVMTAMYSINLAVAGSANLSFIEFDNIFSLGRNFTTDRVMLKWITLLIIVVIVILMKLLLDWFLKTKLGFLLTITGDNPQLVSSLGIDIGKMKIFGLSLSNAYSALSGAVVCQVLGYFDINMNKGIVVIGLASVILGMSVFKSSKVLKATTMVILGSIGYRFAISLALNMGLEPSNLNLIMATIFVIVLVASGDKVKALISKVKR